MQPTDQSATRYDGTTILLHWLIFLIVACQWIGAQLIDDFPSGWPRVDARSTHIAIGCLLAALLLFRMGWRATGGRRLPPADAGMLHVAAKATHWCLYALLTAMVAVGMFLAWTRGDSIFGLFTIPAFRPGDRALTHQVQDLHATIGWIIVAVVSLHAGAALLHQFVWRDSLLHRMRPGPPAS